MCKTCAAFYDPITGETYADIIFQALFFVASLDTFIVPAKLRSSNGCGVYYFPKQFTKGKSLRGIYFPEKYLAIQIYMIVMMLYVPIRLPSWE